ncbi:MAG TPA: hypothetical protein VHX20_02700 [Terracidiphilus sp.]|jgi:hypothetical protein|nr:hypothetical protein [Terracidiphilus sp.]
MGALRKHPPINAVADIERLASEGFAIVGIAKHLGVGKDTFKRWRDEISAIDEAFEHGREMERQTLHALIKRDAVAGKPANANAMFLLKCRHNYREMDSPHTKVDVNVAAIQPVMIVRDHGTDEEWAAKCAAQQQKLLANAGE